MKVSELIQELEKCPQNASVVFFANWDSDALPVNEVSPEDSDGRVVLGSDLPPEVFARDSKYDR